MKLIPIVALVSEDTADRLQEWAALVDLSAFQDQMERNGWTAEMLVAGTLLGNVLDEAED